VWRLSAVVFGDSPDGEAMEDFSVDNAVFVFLADGNVGLFIFLVYMSRDGFISVKNLVAYPCVSSLQKQL
jgi:hypothetical protein